MQGRGDEYAIAMADPGERDAKAPGKRLLGSIVWVLTPSKVAQPAGGAMNPSRSLGLVGEQRRRPFLHPVAIEQESALTPGNRGASRDQRIRLPLPGGNEPVDVTFTQSKRRENDAWRCCYGNQLA